MRNDIGKMDSRKWEIRRRRERSRQWQFRLNASLHGSEENNCTNEYEDVFSKCKDRSLEAPLPLPKIRYPKRVVLVRHGQSTWNASGTMQGSSDYSELTAKGCSQAQTTALLLEKENFDGFYSSPLRRATQTAEIVWGKRKNMDSEPKMIVHQGLREIDLYSFQGLDKKDAKERFPEEYEKWKQNVENFCIDGHYPVRELWYRASLVW